LVVWSSSVIVKRKGASGGRKSEGFAVEDFI